jgi:dienelactone hydrolase
MRRIRHFAASLLLTALPLLAAAVLAQSASTPASYASSVGAQRVEETAHLVLRDARRGKDLQLRLLYPAAGGSYPVILFSHGAGGSKECCTELVQHWASHGYVVVLMTHADSVRLRREQGETASVTAALTSAVRQLGRPENRQGRTDDVKFVIDSLGEIAKRVPALAGKMDTTRIGVGGHSAGALTSQLMGGAKISGRGDPDHTDPRPQAFLLLSPQGRGSRLGFTEESWKSFTKPMLVMSGSLDTGAGGEQPEWRRDPYTFAPPGAKYLVFIAGAHHGSFVGNLRGGAVELMRGAATPQVDLADQQRIFEWVRVSCIAFWDAHLKGDAAARNYLVSDSLHALAPSRIEFLRK